tara:strand:+ start:319 stop:513 length:195 start_codon:yes stop_codon:yes gene_type:complete
MKPNTTKKRAAENINTDEFVSDMALNLISVGECIRNIKSFHRSQEQLNMEMQDIIDSCKKYIVE